MVGVMLFLRAITGNQLNTMLAPARKKGTPFALPCRKASDFPQLQIS